jgi:hypothetical protein
MSQDQPEFQDGASGITDAFVTCLNDSSMRFLYAGDDIGEEGIHVAHARPSGEALGGHTQATGFYRGPMNLQLEKAADALPRPSFILVKNSSYFKISGNLGPKRTKNNVVQFTAPVEGVINPIISTLLSSLGQRKAATFASGGGDYSLDCDAVNVRAGSSLAWAISAWTAEFPTATLPAGCSINAGTGAITFTTPGAGTYYLKVTVTETLTGETTRTGVGFLVLTVT